MLVTLGGVSVQALIAFEAELHFSRTMTLRQEDRQLGTTVVVERKRRFAGSDLWTTVWMATYQKKL